MTPLRWFGNLPGACSRNSLLHNPQTEGEYHLHHRHVCNGGGTGGRPHTPHSQNLWYGTAGWGQEHLHVSARGHLFLGALMGCEGGKKAILAARHLITSRVPPTSMPEIMHWSFSSYQGEMLGLRLFSTANNHHEM